MVVKNKFKKFEQKQEINLGETFNTLHFETAMGKDAARVLKKYPMRNAQFDLKSNMFVLVEIIGGATIKTCYIRLCYCES